MLHQASGLPNTDYKSRFLEAMAALDQALAIMECKVDLDATGTAYVVFFQGGIVGGPSSRKEDAMRNAIKQIMAIRVEEARRTLAG